MADSYNHTEKFQALDHVPMGICIIDKEYRVIFWNICLENWTSIQKKQIIGKSIIPYLPNYSDLVFQSRLKSVFNGGKAVIFSHKLYVNILIPTDPKKKNRVYHTKVSSIPSKEEGGKAFALFAIEDVTKLSKQAHDYKTLKDKALEDINSRKKIETRLKGINKFRTEFMANMSHELRTPLNSILILSRLLFTKNHENLTEKQIEFLKTIHLSGNDLLELIDEILDLSKVEAGKMVIQKSSINIEFFITKMRKTFEPIALDKNLKFITIIADELPETFYSDQQRIEQILKNLISNSLKFTDKGHVTLKIYKPEAISNPFYKKGEKSGVIALSVEDTGTGIHKKKQKLIFEAFQQADGTISRYYGGTGLGLSISSKLAELLGGKIMLESTLKNGSTFTLYIPDSESDDEKENLISAKTVITDENHRTGDETDTEVRKHDDIKCIFPETWSILIFDNDPENINKILGIAQKNKISVIVAEDMESCIHLADFYKPSTMFINGSLVINDSISVYTKMQKNPVTKNIKTTLLTVKGAPRNSLKIEWSSIVKTPVSEPAITSHFKDIQANPEVPSDKRDAILKNKKILLIDHDMRNIYALHNLLLEKKLNIRVAKNGALALSILETEKDIDIILSELLINDMNDYSIIKNIRAIPDYKKTPLIILTSKAEIGERQKCMKVGANDYLSKPVNTDKLLSMIRVWLY